MAWYKIAEHINELDFGPNQVALVTVKGKKICIGLYQQQAFAFAYTCPHAGGLLVQGYIDELGNIVCPLHRYKFNIKNGRNTSGEGFYLTTWQVEVSDDGVYVNMPGLTK